MNYLTQLILYVQLGSSFCFVGVCFQYKIIYFIMLFCFQEYCTFILFVNNRGTIAKLTGEVCVPSYNGFIGLTNNYIPVEIDVANITDMIIFATDDYNKNEYDYLRLVSEVTTNVHKEVILC